MEPERMDSAAGNEGLDVVESRSGSGPRVGVGAGKEGNEGEAKSMKGGGRVLRFWYWPELVVVAVVIVVVGVGVGPVTLGQKGLSMNSGSGPGSGNSGTVGVSGKKAADVSRLDGNDIDGSGCGSGFGRFIIVSKLGTLGAEGSGPKMSFIEAAMKVVYSASSMKCDGVPIIIIFSPSSSPSPVMLPPPAPPSWLALMVLVAYAGGSEVVVVVVVMGTLKSRPVVPSASPGGRGEGEGGELGFIGSVLLVLLGGETCCGR